jgi:hypothetical protein
MNVGVAEHLYIDERRLISYSNQIAGSVDFKKVPVMSGDVSLLGPKAAVGEVVIPVQLQIDDRIRIVEQHLRKYRHVEDGRIASRGAAREKEPPFRCETCVVAEIFVPRVTVEDLIGVGPKTSRTIGSRNFRRHSIGFPGFRRDSRDRLENAKAAAAQAVYRRNYDNAARQIQNFPGLRLWYSRPERNGAELFLIADAGHTDDPSYGFGSAFSVLRALTHHIGEAGDLTKLRMVKHADENGRTFSGDPLSVLTRLGAHAGWNREIRCLYRLREVVVYKVGDEDGETLATIGYPIWIDAA